ncbi:D-alanine--poly(phosphoribitol) ligase subunit DltA [[Clostridium] symbiosum]|uniref:D-alanine--poly(phosphoribitol) ligase subunit DltA n=1 Tax=Clostridium symbiosum TaxID=1512 RepID=UPI001D090CAD|nr:D-alanine--poly(phosphoribitol) ligase subunit DltA [[Clostridium] symbiosum]MCB6610939.1 D-alanine--poly(phosphoribitol) ligase subunit DltA [[Clostridium] symbiosum]MCB6931615.1 D-alanine--poly(phosphoribitol) ligase subunit DltA [[Clostridium] symbiosum]
MITIIEKINQNAKEYPTCIAYYCEKNIGGDKSSALTWQELKEKSDKLAYYLSRSLTSNTPIIVYGHKDPYMLVCFLACVKSGRAYCPIDISVPLNRIEAIIKEVSPEIILTTEELSLEYNNILSYKKIHSIIENETGQIEDSQSISSEDVFYIIFTSGSTGTPKGVQITRDSLDRFIQWGLTLGSGIQENEKNVFLNQAPFSFDLSVMDLYLSLYSGGTLWALDKKVQGDMRLLFESFKQSEASIWVSTPSFADVCLVDPSFRQELLPKLKRFLFCGETLTNRTAERLMRAFPNAEIVNTYGPTESTVAVTEVLVTPEVNQNNNPLPVGKAKKGTWIFIMDEQGNSLPEGEHGEIVIVGDTVSVGYWNNQDRTRKVFGVREIEGHPYRLYHTGDKGYLKDGQLFYCGRIDLQIKLHGYRIELEDIESNIMKLPEIQKAAVLPVYRDGQVRSLTAYVVTRNVATDSFSMTQKLREKLKEYLPEYMIPKKMVFLETLPMTNNGKVDRRALGGMKR